MSQVERGNVSFVNKDESACILHPLKRALGIKMYVISISYVDELAFATCRY